LAEIAVGLWMPNGAAVWLSRKLLWAVRRRMTTVAESGASMDATLDEVSTAPIGRSRRGGIAESTEGRGGVRGMGLEIADGEVLPALVVVLDCVGVEGRSVMELDTGPKLEGVCAPIALTVGSADARTGMTVLVVPGSKPTSPSTT